MTTLRDYPKDFPPLLAFAVTAAAASFAWVLCACGPPDVSVEKLPTPPSVGSSEFDGTVPGFPGKPYEHPTELKDAACPEPQPSVIVWGGVATNGAPAPKPQIGKADGPTNNQFVAFWTICNQGQAKVDTSTSYQMITSLRTTDHDLPPTTGVVTTPLPDKSPSLPIPQLDHCRCFVQEVGINMDVPAAATTQSTIMGLTASFPRVDLPAKPPDTTQNQTFQYVLSLPDNFGTQSLIFEVL